MFARAERSKWRSLQVPISTPCHALWRLRHVSAAAATAVLHWPVRCRTAPWPPQLHTCGNPHISAMYTGAPQLNPAPRPAAPARQHAHMHTFLQAKSLNGHATPCMQASRRRPSSSPSLRSSSSHAWRSTACAATTVSARPSRSSVAAAPSPATPSLSQTPAATRSGFRARAPPPTAGSSSARTAAPTPTQAPPPTPAAPCRTPHTLCLPRRDA